MNERIVDSYDASVTNSTTMTVMNCMQNHVVFSPSIHILCMQFVFFSFVYLYKSCPNTEANPMLITTHALCFCRWFDRSDMLAKPPHMITATSILKVNTLYKSIHETLSAAHLLKKNQLSLHLPQQNAAHSIQLTLTISALA